jgi:uncharacterized protein DUF6513
MPHYLFVTGRLAEPPLERLLASLAPQVGFEYSVAVMPITIAALITPRWLARRLEVPAGVTGVVLPGHCEGDLFGVEEVAGVPVQRGPRDFRELAGFFGYEQGASQWGAWDIEIIARISRADDRSGDEVLDLASSLIDDGADMVLLWGSGRPWPTLSTLVQELREEECRVAVGNVAPVDLLSAIHQGIELVFPADMEQEEAAVGLGCEIVVQGNDATDDGLVQMVESAVQRGIRHRIDLGLRPVGLGLAESVGRYLEARRAWPDAGLVMSLDGLTGTAPVDTAALHLLLVALCEELRIGSVVVCQDTNWNRTAVRECHLARQLTCHAKRTQEPMPHAESGLLILRDAAALEFGSEELDRLAEVLKDPSPRLYAESGRLHAVSDGKHLQSDDPYDLFDQILTNTDRTFDANKAFYLGYEMAKAMTALTLGKTYRQDEALDWGLLTQRELTRLELRALRLARLRDGECDETREYFEEDDLDDSFEESTE